VALEEFYQYRELQKARIVNNRASLSYKIKHQGFPVGRLLGPNTRAWTKNEIEAWLASRPKGKVSRSVTPEAREKAKAAKARRLKQMVLFPDDNEVPDEG